MKFRQLFATAALGVVLAAPAASAQAAYQSSFWFNSTGGNTEYDEYTGSFDNVTFFQIICVNPDRLVADGLVDADAWVTPFDNATGSNVLNPNSNVWLGDYLNAAQLGSLMIGNATTQIWDDAEIISLQNAIWWAMGFNEGNLANYNHWQGVFAGSGIVLNVENWVVVTPTDAQEFITFVDTPFETVPEPATMTLLATGLAGLAAARRRRKS